VVKHIIEVILFSMGIVIAAYFLGAIVAITINAWRHRD
jgi:hypothetical protein